MLEHLPLHALESVVDRLRVAAEILSHLLVGVALEIEPESVALERRQPRAEAEDEALEFLRRDDADDRVVDAGARKRIAERAVAVVLPGGRVAERNVRVERCVLEAGRRLDRRDDLARDAELGEAAKRRLLVGSKIAHGLVEANQAFLDEVVRLAAGEEVGTRLQADEAGVAADERVERHVVAVASPQDQPKVFEFSLGFLKRAGRSELTAGHRFPPWASRPTLTLRLRSRS
jgi:hypothetical protein